MRGRDVAEVAVVEKVTYQAVLLVNKMKLFMKYERDRIKKAQKLTRITYSIIERSCNKLLVGKCTGNGGISLRIACFSCS